MCILYLKTAGCQALQKDSLSGQASTKHARDLLHMLCAAPVQLVKILPARIHLGETAGAVCILRLIGVYLKAIIWVRPQGSKTEGTRKRSQPA